jgi:hypothetical protein
MTRTGVGDGTFSNDSWRGAEPAQLESQRLLDLDRARALAEAAPAALDPRNAHGPQELGRILGEAQTMVAEARLLFLGEVARRETAVVPSEGVASVAMDPEAVVRQLVDDAFPPGSERRARLGQALVTSVGANPAGVSAKLLEAMVARAVGSLSPRPVESARVTLPVPGAAKEAAERSVLGRLGERLFSSATRGLLEARAPRPALVAARAAGVTTRTSLARLDLERARPAAPADPPRRADLPSVPVAAEASHRPAVACPSWSEAAPGLVGRPIGATVSRLEAIQGRADALRTALLGARGGTRDLRAAAERAAAYLEDAIYRAGLAQEILSRGRKPREVLRAVAVGQQELAGVRAAAQHALAQLVAARSEALAGLAGGVREVERLARFAEAELRMAQGRGVLLAEMDAGAARLVDGEGGATPGSAQEGRPAFGAEDLKQIGSGLEPGRTPPQALWTDPAVDALSSRVMTELTDAERESDAATARAAVAGSARGLGAPAAFAAADVAVSLKWAGLELERVDPSQLRAAARYVDGARRPADTEERLAKVLATFRALVRGGVPRLARAQVVRELDTAARVPARILAGLSEAEVQARFQAVAAALNAGEGKAEIKIGNHNLRLEVGADGLLLSSSFRKPGLFAKVWGTVRKVGAGAARP